jgi:two-component system, NarL family, response regulator YdfI
MSSKARDGAIRVFVSSYAASRRAQLENIVRKNKTTMLVGSSYSLTALTRQLREFQPDILLAEISHADSLSIIRTPTLDEESPSVSTVALIEDPDIAWVVRALRNGLKSILSRNASDEEIITAIRAAFSGSIMLEPDIVEKILERVPDSGSFSSGQLIEELTAREIEVLGMLADGLANKAIAAQLGISEHTVKFHISSVLSKMGAATRTEAVTQGIRNGLIVI